MCIDDVAGNVCQALPVAVVGGGGVGGGGGLHHTAPPPPRRARPPRVRCNTSSGVGRPRGRETGPYNRFLLYQFQHL